LPFFLNARISVVLDKTLARKKMKNALVLLLVAVLLLGISSCTQTFYEDVVKDKVAVVGRNLVVLASDTPAEVRVSYYETSDGTSNKLVTKTIQTPNVLDMGKVFESMTVWTISGVAAIVVKNT